jgi:hypothetical protein
MKIKLLFFALILALLLVFVSCNDDIETSSSESESYESNSESHSQSESEQNSEHICNYVFHSSVTVSCYNDGYDLYMCSGCSASKKENIVVSEGHDFGEYVLIVAPTVYENGTRERECSKCFKVENETVEKIKLTITFSLENTQKVVKFDYLNPAPLDITLFVNDQFGDNITTVGDEKFALSLADKIIIGDNITEIPDNAFNNNCENIKTFVIGKAVEKMGFGVFKNCGSLESVYFDGDLPEVKRSTFKTSDGEKFKIYPQKTAKGFEGVFIGDGFVERTWIDHIDRNVLEMSVSEYSKDSATKSLELSKQLFELYKSKNHLPFATLPYTEDINEYKVIKDFALNLTKDCTTEKEKIDTVYNWIVDNIIYDDNATKYDPYKVLTTKRAVCAGYVTLMHDMLGALDIVSFYVRGVTDLHLVSSVEQVFSARDNLSTHAWLCVVNGDNFTFYDPTWGVSDKERYDDMTANELCTYAIALEVNGIEIIIDGADYSMFNYEGSQVQFLYEDGYIYCADRGQLYFEEGSTDYFNYWFAESFLVRTEHSNYKASQFVPVGAVFNGGIICPDSLMGANGFGRADGRFFELYRVLEYVRLQNETYGKNITLADEYTVEKDGMVFALVDGELTLISYNGASEDVTVPSSVNGIPVTTIGISAFKNNSSVKRIVISEGIEYIWVGAFYNCENLEYIYFPKTVKYNTSNEQHTKTSSLTFERCVSLREIEVHSENPELKSLDGVLYSGDMKELICYHATKQGEHFTIPETVEKIGHQAFWGAQFSQITFSKNIKQISAFAFQFSKVQNLVIPSGVTLGDYAFAYATYLESIVIGDGITEVPYGAFTSCQSLAKITFPSTLEEIGEWAFNLCTRLTVFEIPEGVAKIGMGAFCDSSIVSITLPSTLIEIESGAFDACHRLYVVNNLSSLEIEKGSLSNGGVGYFATEINKEVSNSNIYVTDSGLVFYNNGEIVALLDYIDLGAKMLILPETFMGQNYFIADKAFADNAYSEWQTFDLYDMDEWKMEASHSGKYVREIYIPKSVKIIPSHAFTGWILIETIYYAGTEAEWQEVAIDTIGGSNTEFANANVVFNATFE